jgi:hypothetical protein
MQARPSTAASDTSCKNAAAWVMLAFTMQVTAGFKIDFGGGVIDRINLCKPSPLGKTYRIII